MTQWVAALPGAVGRVPAFGIGPLIAASLGIILLGLLRTPLRWSGAVLVLVAALWAARVPQPDILISADGRHVGVRGEDGRLHLMHAVKGSRDSFLLKEWLAADADARTAADASLTTGVSCDDLGCVMQSAGGGLVAQAFRPEALSDDCERAALIVTLRQAPASCAASVIDADRLRRQGAMALRRGREGFVVEAVKAERDRPPVVAGRWPTRARRMPACWRRVSCRRAPSTPRRPRPTCRRRNRLADHRQCSSSEGLEGWAGISNAPR